MALGTFTIVKKLAAVGPVFHINATIVGDGAYSAGGTTGLLAKLQAALGDANLAIIAANPTGINGGYTPVYDVATDKIKVYFGDNANVASGPQVEDTTANQSGRTYQFHIVAG